MYRYHMWITGSGSKENLKGTKIDTDQALENTSENNRMCFNKTLWNRIRSQPDLTKCKTWVTWFTIRSNLLLTGYTKKSFNTKRRLTDKKKKKLGKRTCVECYNYPSMGNLKRKKIYVLLEPEPTGSERRNTTNTIYLPKKFPLKRKNEVTRSFIYWLPSF